MTLESIYYIGQTIAVIAIIATLIALLIQTRQANSLARAELTSLSLERMSESSCQLIESGDFARIYIKAVQSNERLTEDELVRWLAYVVFGISQLENQFNLWEDGFILESARRRAMQGVIWQVSQSRVAIRFWETSKATKRFSPAFIAYFDAEFAKVQKAQESAPVNQP